MDENRKTDLKIYVNKNMIMADNYMEEEEEVPEIKEEKKEEVKKAEKVVLEEMKVEITEKEIESIKQGKTIDQNGTKILLNNNINKKLMLKIRKMRNYTEIWYGAQIMVC
jgi:DNA-directed RNA polymerase subunit E'/Rpb7